MSEGYWQQPRLTQRSDWSEFMCTVCAHWTCSACGWKRPNADRRYPQGCGCGSVAGEFTTVRHQRKETVAEHALRVPPPPWNPVDPAWLDAVGSLAAEVDRITRRMVWNAQQAQSQKVKEQSPEGLVYREKVLEKMRELEQAVRTWVSDHPETADDRTAKDFPPVVDAPGLGPVCFGCGASVQVTVSGRSVLHTASCPGGSAGKRVDVN